MVLLDNGKMKFDRPRFRMTVVFKREHLPPQSDLLEDLTIIPEREFNTLRDISEFLNLSYPTVCNIFKGKTASQGKKWVDRSLCPTIQISKINNSHE